MAISTENIVTYYQADSSGHLRAVQQIKTEQKNLAEQVEKTDEAQQQSADGLLKRWGSTAITLGSVTAAAATLRASFQHLQQTTRLQSAASGVDIDAMSTAAGGLIGRMDLLKLAAQGSTGAFKLNQDQLEKVAGAARTLISQGREETEVLQKLGDAITKGQGGMLDDFGIMLDSTGDKTKDFTNLMRALGDESEKTRGKQLNQIEAMTASGVKISDAIDSIKDSLGRLAVALSPVVDAIATYTDNVAEMIDVGGKAWAMFSEAGDIGGDIFSTGLANKYFGNLTRQQEYAKANNLSQIQATFALAYADAEFEKRQLEGAKAIADVFTNYAKPLAGAAIGEVAKIGASARDMLTKQGKKARSGGRGEYGVNDILRDIHRGQFARGGEGDSDIADYLAQEQARKDAAAQLEADKFAAASAQLEQFRVSNSIGAAPALGYNAAYSRDQYNERLNAQSESALESMFGPIEEFNAYASAFDMLAGSVGSALSAWIDGSESAGTAFRKFVAESVKSLAVQMAIEALKHGAYALGSLAMGNIAGAKLHGVAALKFAAGAVAAGAAAATLGSSSPSAGGGSSTLGVPDAAGGRGGGGPIIVYGDSFAEDSPRMRQRRAQKVVSLALGYGQGAEQN